MRVRWPIHEKRSATPRERELTEHESDVLWDAAERQAESSARGPVGRSEWWPAESRFADIEPSEAEEQADRAARRGEWEQ